MKRILVRIIKSFGVVIITQNVKISCLIKMDCLIALQIQKKEVVQMTTYESKQLLKSVMSITEGIELGTVSDIIIDGENKKVIALGITKDKLFYKALRVIPFEKFPQSMKIIF